MPAEHYGPWAVIAGGSEGVGASYARRLAAEGIHLVLIARKPQPLADLAAEIRAAHRVEVRTLAQDLTAPDMIDTVRALTDDIEVGFLLYNAGAVSHFGDFLDDDRAVAARMIRLGVDAPTRLCHHFAGPMRWRGRGGIVLVGSLAGYAGAPGEIVYAAAKAFARTFAEGLWHELKPHGVDVQGLILGLTRTPSAGRLGLAMDNPDFVPDEPDAIAAGSFAHLGEGPLWHPGDKEAAARYLGSLPRAEAVGFMAAGAKALHG